MTPTLPLAFALAARLAAPAHAACGEVGTMDGPTVVAIRNGTIRQPLGVVVAEGDWDVAVAMGNRDAPGAETFAGYAVALTTDQPYEIGRLTSSSAPGVPGTFADVVGTLHVAAGHPATGAAVYVEITATSPFGGTVVDADHVRISFQGSPIVVANADFEADAVCDGCVGGAPTGWSGVGEVFNPAGDAPYLATTADDDCCVEDTDGDGTPDCTDGCPDDPDATAPGVCGCGVADDDTDGDGAADCVDPCPADPLDDADGDGACADVDGCPDDPDLTAPGACGCDAPDADGDGAADCVDPCPTDAADACGAPTGGGPDRPRPDRSPRGCASATGAPGWAGVALGLLALARRGPRGRGQGAARRSISTT